METPRLERRPEARAFSVEALLQQVREGKIRIPDFQRPLRWRATHVLDLFDSVYRGFPVGDLLFFKRPAEPAHLHVGPVTVHAPAVPDAHFVVDGQQRITALASAMLHPDPRPYGDIYALWFDLEEECFTRVHGGTTPPSFIPLNVVGDSIKLLTWLHEWPFRAQRPDLVQRAIGLGKALREYQIPAYIVEGASDEVLRLIFKRVNTSGVAMTEIDVFGALFRGKDAHPIESACARLQTSTGFGNISTYWFLRCLKAVEDFDVTRELSEEQVTRLDPTSVERTESAILRVIRFLAEDAGIPHVQLLPAALPLVVLARYFHLHPAPTERSRVLLSRWVWRDALGGTRYSTDDETLQRTSRLVDRHEFASVERLLGTISQATLSLLSRPMYLTVQAYWSWSHATDLGKPALLALTHLGARNPKTGEALGSDGIRALVDEQPMEDIFVDVFEQGSAASTIARRVLVSSPDQVEGLATALPEILESHGIDQEAADALGRCDIETFTKRRQATLNQYFQHFFSERLGLDDGDRPPVDELIRRVENALAAE